MPYYQQQRGGFLSNIPVVTRNLLVINVVMFIATLVNEDFMVGTFSMFYPASPFFRFWQPVTYMFMHGGFWHIFFNMYTLLMFGTVVSDGEPLRVRLSEKVVLEEDMLIRIWEHSHRDLRVQR